MKISRSETHDVLKSYVDRSQGVRKEGPGSTGAATGQGVDHLSFSPQAREMQRLQELLQQVPDVREELVAPIRRQLDNGTYNVRGDMVASRIVARLMGDKLA